MAELLDTPTTLGPGMVKVCCGPMFSGKTAQMLSDVQTARYAGLPCVVVKYEGDTRYSAGARIVSHGGAELQSSAATEGQARVRVVAARRLGEVELEEDERVIGIDEGQFFADLAAQADAWADRGLTVVVAALDASFYRKPFGGVSELAALAEHVVKLRGVCMKCRQRPSAFTQLLADAETAPPGPDGAPRRIGGLEAYRAVCRGCWAPPVASRPG